VFHHDTVGGSCAKGMVFEEQVGPWWVDVLGTFPSDSHKQ
jgi:hypothetical protein